MPRECGALNNILKSLLMISCQNSAQKSLKFNTKIQRENNMLQDQCYLNNVRGIISKYYKEDALILRLLVSVLVKVIGKETT